MDGQGEKALLVAIIIQAVQDMRGAAAGVHRGYKPAIQREARQWLMSERRGGGSFVWICETLDLSASWLRRELLNLVETGGKVKTARTRMDQSC